MWSVLGVALSASGLVGGVVAFAIASDMSVGAPMSADPSSVRRLGWMAGCWERARGNEVVEEQWMRPRGGTLIGMSRTTRGDSTVAYESMRIYEAEGRVVFAAQPSGQAPAEFHSEAVTDSTVVFANPTHDFPQRVSYRQAGTDSLIARIEGSRSGKLHGVDFPMRRIACAG
jgi:Domain of unknown function (DUF6265)